MEIKIMKLGYKERKYIAAPLWSKSFRAVPQMHMRISRTNVC